MFTAEASVEITPNELMKPYVVAENRYIPVPEERICNCVQYLKRKLGITSSLSPTGLAKDIPIKTKTPFVGAILITFESPSGHVAHVVDIDWQTKELILDEYNYIPCKHGIRRLSLDAPVIKGYR